MHVEVTVIGNSRNPTVSMIYVSDKYVNIEKTKENRMLTGSFGSIHQADLCMHSHLSDI